MKNKGFVQFNWKCVNSQDEPILITVDSDSSRGSGATGNLTGIFGCCK